MSEFVKKVERMRKLQKQYFKTRDRQVLQDSKAAERDVDQAILNYGQGELF